MVGWANQDARELIPSIGLAFCLMSFWRVASSHSLFLKVDGGVGPTGEEKEVQEGGRGVGGRKEGLLDEGMVGN